MDNQEKDSQQKQFFALFANYFQYALTKKHDKHHMFRIVGFNGSGAGIFEPIDATCAKYLKKVPPEHQRAYLNTLSDIHMIMSYETDRGWLCYPFAKLNTEDPLHDLRQEVLVQNIIGCERFDIISARYDGTHFWFDSKVMNSNSLIKSEAMRLCLHYDLPPERMKYNVNRIGQQLTQEDYKAFSLAVQSWLIFQRQSSETQQLDAQVRNDGVVGSYVVHGADDNMRPWHVPGYKYVSIVDDGLLNVTCMGIDISEYESIIKQERIEDE